MINERLKASGRWSEAFLFSTDKPLFFRRYRFFLNGGF